MGRIILAVLFFGLFPGLCAAQDLPKYTDAKDRASYSLGYQIGGDLARQNRAFDSPAFLGGLKDGLSDASPKLNRDEMQTILKELKRQLVEQEIAARRERTQRQATNREAYRSEDRDFLAANGVKEGVVTLQSGVQYLVIKEGSGKRPGPNDAVLVNYRGTLVDGREFGSSERKGTPATFPVSSLIPGLRETLQEMNEGAKWKIVIPPDLGFGERGPLADRVVIYEIELLSVEPQGTGGGTQ